MKMVWAGCRFSGRKPAGRNSISGRLFIISSILRQCFSKRPSGRFGFSGSFVWNFLDSAFLLFSPRNIFPGTGRWFSRACMPFVFLESSIPALPGIRIRSRFSIFCFSYSLLNVFDEKVKYRLRWVVLAGISFQFRLSFIFFLFSLCRL